jgi:hypothetical protein
MEPRKTFRDWTPKAYAHQPVIPAVVLPEDDLVFFLIELVPQLDLTPFYAYYERETRGAPPYDVALMTTLLVYSYCVGVFSSRKIAPGARQMVRDNGKCGQDRKALLPGVSNPG